LLIFAYPRFSCLLLTSSQSAMLITLIDAFKEVLRLSDKEISKAIDISDSTIVKHRKDHSKEFSPKVTGLIIDFVQAKVNEKFPAMSPEKRLYLWRRIVDVANALQLIASRQWN
jgi:hypothetical protein